VEEVEERERYIDKRAKLHPLHILCRYTSLSLLLPPPAHCHWPITSLSSPTTTDHLVTRHLYKPRSFCRSAYSSLMMEAVRNSETSVDNHFTRQYNPEDSSEHHTRRRENLKSHYFYSDMIVQAEHYYCMFQTHHSTFTISSQK
jgi:hypothetical protein